MNWNYITESEQKQKQTAEHKCKKRKMNRTKKLRHVYALYYRGDERKKNLWRWMLWFDDHAT